MNKKFIGLLIVFSIILIGCNNVIRVNEKNEIINIKETDLKQSENYKGINNCEEGYNLAEKEIQGGKLKYIFGSVGGRQELPNKLEKQYGIEIIKLEGIIALPNRCYNDIMYKEIQRRFGKDAFNKVLE